MTARLSILATLIAGLALVLSTARPVEAKDAKDPIKDPNAPRSYTVSIRGGAFTPAKLTIRAGDTVVWVNGDDRDHTVTAVDGSFNSGNIGPGGSFTVRFAKPGNISYSCTLHPRMRGTVSVQ